MASSGMKQMSQKFLPASMTVLRVWKPMMLARAPRTMSASAMTRASSRVLERSAQTVERRSGVGAGASAAIHGPLEGVGAGVGDGDVESRVGQVRRHNRTDHAGSENNGALHEI